MLGMFWITLELGNSITVLITLLSSRLRSSEIKELRNLALLADFLQVLNAQQSGIKPVQCCQRFWKF